MEPPEEPVVLRALTRLVLLWCLLWLLLELVGVRVEAAALPSGPEPPEASFIRAGLEFVSEEL